MENEGLKMFLGFAIKENVYCDCAQTPVTAPSHLRHHRDPATAPCLTPHRMKVYHIKRQNQ